jgi:soluble lytic murein transglycosylase-like protein
VVGLLLSLALSQIQVGTAETAPLKQEPSLSQSTVLPGLFTQEVLAWEDEILLWSEQYQLNPNLVATVMQIESCGYLLAESPSGARGLFQVMPYHFQAGEDPFDPDTNALRGLRYLRQSKEAGKNNRLALAGYNGGIQGAQRSPDLWPKETSRYVYWGLGIYKDAQAGLDHSPRLEEWLNAGGRSLCQKARLNP